MKVHEIERTATFAWAPLSPEASFIATGPVSGALDVSFSTNTLLEVFSLADTSRPVAAVPTPAR